MTTKTTKTTTALLPLVLVASFAGAMISMPQMIGSVKAQFPQCPHSPYNTFKSGSNGGLGAICEDSAPTLRCQPSQVDSGSTATPDDNGICTSTLTYTSDMQRDAFASACSSVSGSQFHDTPSGGGAGTAICQYLATQTCHTPN